MLAWMLYVIMVTLLLSVGAYVAERAARLSRGGTRWVWLTAIVASLAIPTVIASVTVQLPNVANPTVAQKIIEDHGGDLRLENSSAKGSTFVVVLPLGPREPKVNFGTSSTATVTP